MFPPKWSLTQGIRILQHRRPQASRLDRFPSINIQALRLAFRSTLLLGVTTLIPAPVTFSKVPFGSYQGNSLVAWILLTSHLKFIRIVFLLQIYTWHEGRFLASRLDQPRGLL